MTYRPQSLLPTTENDRLDDEREEQPDPRTFRPDLYEAAKRNDTEQVLSFLLGVVPCNYIDPKTGWTALHWAALHGNVPLTKKILLSGGSAPYRRLYNRLRKSSAAHLPVSSKKHVSINKTSRRQSASTVHTGRSTLDDGTSVTSSLNNDEVSNEEKSYAEGEESELDDVEEDEEENDEIVEEDLAEENKFDFFKNTPLLLACSKGHFEVMWLLLLDGYSSNDVDDFGNNALHLAAASGNLAAVNSLINDGANSNLVNSYKNRPIDMALTKEIRDVLAVAMEKYASNTQEDIEFMNRQNLKMYRGLLSDIQRTISESTHFEIKSSGEISKLMGSIDESLRISREWKLDEIYIAQAENLLLRMEITQDLIADIDTVERVLPLTTQAKYDEYVNKLVKTLKRAEKNGIDKYKIERAKELVAQCQMEYWLFTTTNRVKHVTCADDPHEHDMILLQRALEKYESSHTSREFLDEGMKLYRRLKAELGMNRALRGFPTVRLPMENPPEGYYQPVDLGHVVQTPEYPNVPADNGGYIWEPSETYTSLKNAIQRLYESYNGAEAFGANVALCAQAKEKLVKAEKEMKALEAKNTTDKALGIEAAIKLAKKLRKKGRKSPKSKGPKPVPSANA